MITNKQNHNYHIRHTVYMYIVCFTKKRKENASLLLDLYFTFMAHFDSHSFYFTISLRNPKSVEKRKRPRRSTLFQIQWYEQYSISHVQSYKYMHFIYDMLRSMNN